MYLKTNNRIYNVFCDNINDENPKIYGYIYENNHFYSLNEDIFKELNKLKIGSNTKKIGDYEKDNHVYDVILDLDTNLKHYFLNGKEDYNLFINNFEDVIIADNKNIKYTDNLADKKRKNDVGALVITGIYMLTMLETGLFIDRFYSNSLEFDNYKSQHISELMNNTPELTPEIISNLIKNNKNISDSDKEILLNNDFLEFACPYINKNKEYAAKLYNIILPNFTIKEKDLEAALGSWDPDNYIINMNVNDIKQQCESYSGDVYDDVYNDIMLHEFVHLFQVEYQYPFLYEASAEMISQEYVVSMSYASCVSYPLEQKYIKILMEIIGSKPIAEYNFTGSIEPIKKELELYLSESEINKLFELFKYNSNYVLKNITQEQFENNLHDIEKIYSKLYYNKYHCSMRGNSEINEYLDENSDIIDYSFNKYYFNNCNEQKYDDDLYDALNYKIATNTYYPAYNQILAVVSAEDLLNNLDFDTLKQAFYSNQNLSSEEKAMLFNEELINDYIYYTRMYLNDRISGNGDVPLYYNRYDIISCLKKLRITNDDRCIIGTNPNNEFPYRISATDLENCEILISESNCKQYASKNNFLYDDVYQKEKVEQFVNLLPENYNNSILYNACTSIILKEYYGIGLPKKDEISIMEEKATKMLIELVGDEPLKYYYFTGSDKLIREKLTLLEDVDYSDTVNTMNIFKSTIYNEDSISDIKCNLNLTLFYLYNINSGKKYDLSDSENFAYWDHISENFMDNYYIPETKGYFSDSYIEKDKLIHPEHYNNIELGINNDLGKNR